MKCVKCITVLIISIFIISSILPNVGAQSGRKTLLDRILVGLFKYSTSKGPIANVLFGPFNTPWKIGPRMGAAPQRWVATPDVLNITYLDEVEIILRLLDPETGLPQIRTKKEVPNPKNARLVLENFFEIELPTNVPEGAFIARFDPPSIGPDFTGELGTKLTITSNIPKDAALPSEFLLKIRVIGYTTWNNLFKVFGPVAFLYDWAYNLSGKRLKNDIPGYVEIVVKLNRFHLAEINPPKIIEIGSNELKSIPIEIKNLGSHADTFNFRINANTDGGLLLSSPPAITLQPNEVGYTSIGVATTRRLQDPGTLHPISIEAYSIYEPDKVFKNTVSIMTKGVYVSEANWIYSSLFGVIILLVIAFLLLMRKKKLEKIYNKPKKPWEIPEEKEYLEKLKKENKEEYKNVLKMMAEEYESTMLWYKSYLKAMIKEEKETKQKIISKKGKVAFIPDIFKKLKVKKVETKKSITPKKKKILVKTKGISEKPDRIDTEVAAAERKKQEVILRIKREQEKQKKKFETSI